MMMSTPGQRNCRDTAARIHGHRVRRLTRGPHLCEPTVYEDNIAFGGTFSEFARSVPPHDIMGIEVYTTATEPPQFPGACGVIVVWTRTGV
jgi:hypothetical protein